MALSDDVYTASREASGSFPPELDALVDFIADDARPTCILEHLTSTVVYRNAAFDTFVATDPSTPGWFEGLLDAIHNSPVPKQRTTETLGIFASHIWSSKSIGTSWTAVFCHEHPPANTQYEPNPVAQVTAVAEATLPIVHPLRRQESDNTSTHSTSTTMSSLASSDMETPLEDLFVDWLLFADRTSDPWIDFLVNHNWESKAVGPVQSWPTMLRQIYTTILASREPRIIYWGNDMLMLYNEQARFVTGEMHPLALGEPFIKVWGIVVLTEIIKMIRTGAKRGKAVLQRDHEFILMRYGYPESCFFDVVLLPIPSPEGRFLGVVTEFTEVTEKVLQKHRREMSKALLQNILKVTDVSDLRQAFVRTVATDSKDISYAVVYSRSKSPAIQDTETFHLEAYHNIKDIGDNLPDEIVATLRGTTSDVVVLQQSKGTLPKEFAVSIPDIGLVDTAYVLPIVGLDGVHLSDIAILGLNPRRSVSPSVRQFAESIRDLLFKSFALCSLPLEQRQAQEFSQALSQQLETMTVKAEISERNFTRMLRDAPIGMCMHRSDGHCVYVNDILLELLGMSRANFFKAAEEGIAWREAVHDDDFEAVNQTWTAAIETGKPMSAEFRVKPNLIPNEVRWLEISAQQRHDQDGHLEYLYVWLRDVSSRKQLAEQKLADALETKRRSEIFIDMVSHEMRNPLGAILLLADGILSSLPCVSDPTQSSILTADARSSLVDVAANIQLCARHQKVIIDEVLTFSRLDSKLLVLAPEQIRPTETVQSVLKMVKAELDYDKIQGSMALQPSYTDLAVDNVLLDPGRLAQIILNFMTNAIKFTKNSDKRHIVISIGASRTQPSADDCQVTLIKPRGERVETAARRLSITEDPIGEDIYLIFSVRDTGCGLTETEMGHLFHRFSQASPKTYKQYGGSGLGLFISRELVELQGGQIGVHSEYGKGSTFAFYIKTARVEIPVEPPTAELAQTSISDHMRVVDGPTAQKPQTADLHVLVVEDNAINQKILAQQLRKTGCAKVHVADHGQDALELLSTTTFFKYVGIDQVPLSVILLDVEMPIMDGLTCARRIRELEQKHEIIRHVPIIGITANARVEQISACIEAGMDEVVTKPFRVMDLLPRMLALVDKHASVV
ncbi:hypothetical protein D6D15_09039 [Aureobasidium pullulans]|uniref:Histidine kinase HHK15p n=1 Tax=Aureobasidium pullulans TaxID=5580 RepID=A0A4S9AVH3_AURPU|nr:hypothetical protein D6D15_09039 [Aureobasidium pullulans]